MDQNSNFDTVISKGFTASEFVDLFTCKGKF